MPYKDPDKRREHSRQYRKEHLDKFRNYNKKYYWSHHALVLERGRKKRQMRKDQIRKHDRERDKRPERVLAKKLRNREKHQKIRLDVLSHYSNGDPKCAHCGNRDIRVLTLDHISNDGAKHKEQLKGFGISYLRWIQRHNYPPVLQVLCMNCNWIKRWEHNEDVFRKEIEQLKLQSKEVMR